MRWSTGHPFGPVILIDRWRLRRAALRYAARGWAVTAAGPCRCGRPGCRSWDCDPAPGGARLLLATGWVFDVLEVPAPVGLRALGATRLHADVLGPTGAPASGPVAVTPAGRWMFFVRPGAPLRAELAHCLDVVHHGRGGWVPAAPGRLAGGTVRWAVPPGKVHWRLPDPAAVQATLADALAALRRHPIAGPAARPARPGTVPRQLSTSRRAD